MAFTIDPEPNEEVFLEAEYAASEKSEPFAFGVSNRAVFLPAKKRFVLTNDPFYFKRVPLWLVIAILPVCVLAFVAQGTSSYMHENEVRPLSERLVVFSGFQGLCLLICWWWDRRAE